MGFKDKFSSFFTAQEEDYYDDYEDGADTAEEPHREERAERQKPAVYSAPAKDKIVNMSQLQVVLVKPERFDDAPAVADHLNAKRTVVLNLESSQNDQKRRILDFLSGAAYANNGNVKRVAANTFIITPYNVDVMGDMLMDEIETSGLFRG